MKQCLFSYSLLMSVVALSQVVNAQEADDTAPRFEQVSESVLRAVHRPGAANSNVIVTDEGLIVVDGTCRGAGDPTWMKQELARRYDVPVKYVILSHDHEDHICDLHVFDDTAVTVSHRITREHIVREGRNTSVPDVVFDDQVLQLNIEVGGQVEEDDDALVIEALKMETVVYVPCDGTVKEIRVKEGDQVEEDDVLAVIAGE